MGTQKNVRKFRQNQPETVQRENAGRKRKKFFADKRSDEFDGDYLEREYSFED